ncbi:N-acetylglucosamine-1-phosphodiester alpha-N-acetylglucosaminidase [Klebsormidium nitens]|uniref:N-acetylglucosamine-1-phosphodiester alpha-N-acetylglucosaminidase n=1 Tax=Klebsormidium nitens TaxID=105231 RepID=A0A1Y1HZ02_KLENI|nr:N-acetylglucosamine-1-phosphodiester alpha-N-acetylglucosaminidase [Klebsormidium nitens]|eukprot:GAQ83884.1 N-acetylglucosamine-1-phosphodiester alpha-N-acetylglucosaminidase [Klebsormidium nitens]
MAPSAMSRNALLLAVVSLAVHAAFGQNITTNLPQVEYPAFNSTNNDGAANITTYLIENNGPNGTVQTGHLSILHNPIGQFVVLPPAAGCVSTSNGVTTGGRSLTSTTAAAGNCHVAANGALFNVTTGGCLGNLVSNGVVIQAPGTQNVNFGLRNGNFVIGYVSALEAQGRAAGKVPFDQLTSGVVWLVKGGQNNVQQDLPYEDPSTQTTGTIQDFASIVSARTAIGHNAAGEILLLQLDGQSNVRGASLYDVADLLISYGAVNAINLDGGGSSAFVTDGILSSYPSDILNATVNGQTFSFRQERAVTSIVCFKDRFKIAPSQPCDPTSQNPNQCFNAAGTLSICCPGACPLRPGPLAVCGPAVPPTTPSPNTVSASSPTTVTTPGSTTGAPTGPVVAAPTVAPTTAGPVPSGTTATAPAKTSAPGVAAGTPPPCDPTSGNPNQCFNAAGTASLCCPGLCPQTPGANPQC